jgi:hypothetical protein
MGFNIEAHLLLNKYDKYHISKVFINIIKINMNDNNELKGLGGWLGLVGLGLIISPIRQLFSCIRLTTYV